MYRVVTREDLEEVAAGTVVLAMRRSGKDSGSFSVSTMVRLVVNVKRGSGSLAALEAERGRPALDGFG